MYLLSKRRYPKLCVVRLEMLRTVFRMAPFLAMFFENSLLLGLVATTKTILWKDIIEMKLLTKYLVYTIFNNFAKAKESAIFSRVHQ